MKEMEYNRRAAVEYARRWALDRNPAYYDFEHIGGDCTNFASQCIYAGAKIMNYTPITGWYYQSLSNRTAAWSGVEYLCKFLVNNQGVGPYGHVVPRKDAMPGDLVQFGHQNGRFYHSPVITTVSPVVLVCTHSYDSKDRPLTSYDYETERYIHIDGVRI